MDAVWFVGTGGAVGPGYDVLLVGYGDEPVVLIDGSAVGPAVAV